MTKILNLANTILILGTIYFVFRYELSIVVASLLILLAVFTWSKYTGADEEKELTKSKTELNKAKANYYNNWKENK